MQSFYNSRVKTQKITADRDGAWNKYDAWSLVKYFMEDLYYRGEGSLEKARGLVGELLGRYENTGDLRLRDSNKYSDQDYTNMLQRIALLESEGEHQAVKDAVDRLKHRKAYTPPKELSKLTIASYFTKEVLENDDTFSYYYNNILSPFHNHIVSFDIIPTVKYTAYFLSTQHFLLQLPSIAYANDKTALMLKIGDVAIQNSLHITSLEMGNYIKHQLDDTTGSLCISYGLTQGFTSLLEAGFSKMLFPQLGVSILAGQVLSKIAFSTTQCHLGHIDQSEIETSKLLLLSSAESILTGGFFLNLFSKQFGVFNDLVKSIGLIKNLITGINIVNTADLLTKHYIISSYEGPDKYLQCNENCHGLSLEANYQLNKNISQNDGLLNQWVYKIGKFAKDKDGQSVILHDEYCNLVKHLQNYKSAKQFTISEQNFDKILKDCRLSDDSEENTEQNMNTDSGMIPRLDYNINRIKKAVEKVNLLVKSDESHGCIQQTKVSHFNVQNYFSDNENKLDFNVPFGCFSYNEVIELKLSYPWLYNGMLTLDMSLDVAEKLQKFCQIPEKIILGCGQSVLIEETEQVVSNLKAANPEEELQTKEWYNAIESLISSERSYINSKGLENGCEVQRVEYHNHCNAVKLPKQMLKFLFNKYVTEEAHYVEENMLHKVSYKTLDEIAGINNMLYWLGDYGFKREKIGIGGVEKLVYKKVINFNNEYCNIIHNLSLKNNAVHDTSITGQYKQLNDRIIEIRKKESELLTQLDEKQQVKVKYTLDTINDPIARDKAIKGLIEKYADSAVAKELHVIREEANSLELTRKSLQEAIPSPEEKFLLAAKIQCADSQVNDYKTNENMMTSGDLYTGLTEFSPLIKTDDVTIQSLSPKSAKQDLLCENKQFKVENKNDCLGLDKIYILPLRYPWLDTKIFTIPLEEFQNGDKLKKYQHENCIVPKAVILGSGLVLEKTQDMVFREETGVHTVLGYQLANHCHKLIDDDSDLSSNPNPEL